MTSGGMLGTDDEGTGQERELAGQVAVVTGGSAGLGRRFAQVLAREGAAVAVVGRRLDKLREVCAEITAGGGLAEPVEFDVTDIERGSVPFDVAEERFGTTATILVNNAGIPDAQYATRMSPQLIDAVLGTNLHAPFVLACEIARRLISAKKPGRIVNISSMGAFSYRGEAPSALYSITKAAINRMTEVLAVEWAKFGINVNAIAPGAFSSEMMDGMVQRIGDFSSSFPRKRLGDPAQLDTTLLYLVSPRSEAVTGTVIKVDDGQGSR